MFNNMSPERSDTKSKILNRAEDLFRQRSYSGFSYNDIAKPLGIKNAAIHYHFPSKGDLGVAIIQRYRRLLARVTRRSPQNGEQARQQLEVLFEFESGLTTRDRRVCPLAVMATDYVNITPAMQSEGQQLVHEMTEWLTQVLTIGRDDGTFRFDGQAADKAVAILAAFVGARQISRVGRSDHFSSTVTQIRRDLGLPVK